MVNKETVGQKTCGGNQCPNIMPLPHNESRTVHNWHEPESSANAPGLISKKNNQTSVSGAYREIQTLGSTDNAGKSVNLFSGIIRLPSGWDFSICIGDR